MLDPSALELQLKSLPTGLTLFIPRETAVDWFGVDADKLMDQFANDCNCHLAVQQSFESTPDVKGFRFTKRLDLQGIKNLLGYLQEGQDWFMTTAMATDVLGGAHNIHSVRRDLAEPCDCDVQDAEPKDGYLFTKRSHHAGYLCP